MLDVVVIVLDVGIEMRDKNCNDSDLSSAVETIKHFIASRISMQSIVSILTIGSNSTRNPLANGSEFQNIYQLVDFQPVSTFLLKSLPDLIREGSFSADPLDGLIVACQLLNDYCLEIDAKKSIFLFTNASSQKINMNGLEEIIALFKQSECQIYVILVGHDKYECKELDYILNSKKQKLDTDLVLKESLSLQNIHEFNAKTFKGIVETLANESQLLSITEFFNLSCKFMAKETRIVSCMRGSIIIESEKLEIPVAVYIKSKSMNLPSFKVTDSNGIAISKAIATIGKEGNVNNEYELRAAYPIGDEFVNDDEINQLKPEPTTKGFHCIGFITENQILRHEFMGSCLEVFSEEDSINDFEMFCKAMIQTKTNCLCNYVRAKNSERKFGVLIPEISDERVRLYFEYLPYNEERMNDQFPVLNKDCSKEQKNIVDKIIEELDIDYNGTPYHNPAIARLQEAVMCKIFEKTLPDYPTITESEFNKDEHELTPDSLKRLIEEFPLQSKDSYCWNSIEMQECTHRSNQ